MKKLTYLLCLVAALSLIAAACGSDSDGDSAGDANATETDTGDSTATDDGDATPDADPGDTAAASECTADNVGGEMTFATYTPTEGLDPVQIGGAGTQSSIENQAVYDTLMRYDLDAGEYVPHLAESLVPNDDNTSWTLTLRDGVTFSNGDPLNGDAVKSSIERHTAEGSTSRIAGLLTGSISTITVVDDLTVQFELTEPFGTFPYVLSRTPGMITNPSVVTSPTDEAFLLDPVGGGVGPYTVERFAPGEELVLKARADYWGGPVCIETLTFIRVPGGQPTWEAFQDGQAQGAFLREPLPNAAAKDAGVVRFNFLQNAGGTLLANNGVRGSETPTSDVRVRQALAMAIDIDLFNERVNGGAGLATNAILDPSSRFNSGLEGIAYNPDEAAALVEEVKAEGNWDGTIRLYCHNAPSRADWPLAMEALLESVGFNVEVKNDWDINGMIKAVLIDADYDLACWGWNLEDISAYPSLNQNFRSDISSNIVGYASPDMDAAIDALKAAGTDAEQKEILADIQEIWNETVPSPIYESVEELIIFDDSVQGVLSNSTSTVSFSDAYLVK